MLRNVREDWFISTVVAIVVVSAGAKYLWLLKDGKAPEFTFETVSSLVDIGVLALTIFFVCFSKWLWKFKPLHTVGFVKYPDLSGTWQGELISARTHERLPMNCVIVQNAWSLSWKAWVPASANTSFVTQFTGDEETQDLALAILYLNVPKESNRAKYGAAHQGSCLLYLHEIEKAKQTGPGCDWELEGNYITNKTIEGVTGTTGSIALKRVSRSNKPGYPPVEDKASAATQS